MTAEELLMMSDDIETYSADDALIVDAENKIILTPAGGLLLGVESDEESERIKFKCPRIVGDNIDLSTLQLRVIYKNANGAKDFRICTDVTIDGSYIRFSWLLSRKVTRYKGTVKFIICAIRTQTDGSIKNEWNTTLAEGIVLEGLEVDIPEEEFEEPKDIVLQLLGMLDEKASDISDAIEAQKAEVISAIQAEKKRVMETIPEDYTYVYNLAEENKQLKANAIKRTYSGETIVATDSSQAKFEGLRVFGRSEQESTTGAQLFDINAEKSEAPGNCYKYEFTLKPNTSYTLSSNVPATTGASLYFNGGSSSSNQVNKDISRTIATDESGYFYVFVRYAITSDADSIALYDAVLDGTYWIMLNEGDTALPYEPYTGGKASPSTDYPQSIESVGDDGSVDVGVYGGNLISQPYTFDSKTINGVAFNVKNDYSIELSGTNTAGVNFYLATGLKLKSGIYTLSGMQKVEANGAKLRVYDEDNLIIVQDLSSNENSATFAITEKEKTISIYLNKGGTNTVFSGTVYPMLNYGTEPLPYEPYKEPQSLTTQTPNGLPGIKVTDSSLATYIDADGVMWCADEVDYANGKYVQRIGKINGEEIGNIYLSISGKFAYFKPTNLDLHINATDVSHALCTVAKATYQEGTDNGIVDRGVSIANDGNIHYRNKDFTTVDEYKAVMKSSDFIIAYIIAEPIETDLTAEEIEAYKALLSNYPTTTILNDENAFTEVTLVADTKNHIEQNYVPVSEFQSVVDRVSALEQQAIS